jgi:Na+/melibiose symporter-like transporter
LQSGTEKLPIKEKIGYAFGDTAANFIFQTMIMFQLTDELAERRKAFKYE